MRLTATIVGDFAGLAAIEPAWLDLVAGMDAPPPSVLPGWSHGLMARHAGDDSFRILAIAADGRLALCFPHRIARRWGACEIAAACEIAPIAVAAPDDALLDRLLDRLIALLVALYGRHALRFDQLDASRPEVARLLAAARRRYRSVEPIRTDANVIVDLSDGWDAARARMTPNAREALRRAHARTRALDSAFEVHERADQPGSVFAAILEIDALSWKYARGGAMARSRQEHVHFAFALARLAEQRQARVFLQRLCGRPAAFIIAFVVGDRAYYAVWSYAEAFGACSPGRLAMAGALRHLAAEGVRTVDFWGRNDAFKGGWSPDTVPRTTLRFHARRRAPAPLRLAAAALRSILWGAPERHRLKRDDPGALRRTIARWTAPPERWRWRWRWRPTSRRLRIARSDARAVSTICQTLTDADKMRLPRRAAAHPPTHCFAHADGDTIATARIVASGRALRVSALTPARWPEDDPHDCAAALLSAFPEARWIYEPSADLALGDGWGIIAAIVAERGR